MSAYWKLMGDHLVQAKGENREGEAAIQLLGDVINKHRKGNVLDFGCGKGRLATLVAPLNYLGYDVNAKMLSIAADDNPDYTFTHSLNEALSYDADITLFYTVISMCKDSEAKDILRQIHSRLIIIGEIADKRWDSSAYATPPIYNRDVSQIDTMLAANGYMQIDHAQMLHERYKDWANDYDKHMHILVYRNGNR